MDVTSPGSSTSKENEVASKENVTLPTAAILCIAIGVYVVLLVVALLIRWYIKAHNLDGNSCCSKEDKCLICNSCCTSCHNCCNQVEAALKSIFCCSWGGCCAFSYWDNTCLPNCCSAELCSCCEHGITDCCKCKNWIPDSCCCGAEDLLCQCDRCDCACTCQLPECQAINCCCFEIRMKS